MTLDWRQIPLLKGISITDSFVLDWGYDNSQLYFELEASIWPESIYYVDPKPNEYTCYRRATIQFNNVVSVSGLTPKSAVMPSKDPDGSVDYGNIDTLQVVEGGFKLTGNFGDVKIVGGELRFEIQS